MTLFCCAIFRNRCKCGCELSAYSLKIFGCQVTVSHLTGGTGDVFPVGCNIHG